MSKPEEDEDDVEAAFDALVNANLPFFKRKDVIENLKKQCGVKTSLELFVEWLDRHPQEPDEE